MIINRLWAIALMTAVALGIWVEQPLLTLAGLFGLLIGGAELLWTRHCLTGVEYERWLDHSHAFWGERVSLTVRVSNRKLLPLTWLRTEDQVPYELPIEHAGVVALGESTYVFMRNLMPMLPYEQVTRRFAVRCTRRGLFQFGPGRVESGDLLGYRTRSRKYAKVERLIVYPKLFELHVPTPRSRRIVGPLSVDRIILTDPSRTVGARPYQVGDPLRHVEWRASARSRDLLVRVFEPTTDPALAIFLNFTVPGFGRDSYHAPELEFSISLAASLAKWAHDRAYPVGMFGNGARGAMRGVRLAVGDGPDQLRRILEALALASPFTRTPLSQVLAEEAPRLPFEAGIVLVTAGFDEQLLVALAEARRRRPVTVLYVKKRAAPDVQLPGLEIVTVPYDDGWLELDALQLAA